MKVDTVHDWSEGEPWEARERVTRYTEVRCPECTRMLYCIHWADIGLPEVHCPVCAFRAFHPFPDHPTIRSAYGTITAPNSSNRPRTAPSNARWPDQSSGRRPPNGEKTRD